MNRWNEFFYNDSRRFLIVFPTYERFKENIFPYLNNFPSTNLDEIGEIIYNRLKLKYSSSFFRFERIGSCYECTVTTLNSLIPYFIRLNFLEKIELDELKNLSYYSESENYLTDNTNSQNIDGFETDKSITRSTSYTDMNKLSKDLLNIRKNIESEIQKYGKYFLSEIQERRLY